MTQIERAKTGKTTNELKAVARQEGLEPAPLRAGIASGTIVIPKNRLRAVKKPCGIGKGLRTKVNANIGTSKDSASISAEIRKMKAAIALGSDTIMDLSTGPGISKTRKAILSECDVPVGTVPIYEIAINALNRYNDISHAGAAEMLDVLEEQALEGVDFFTIHAGVTRSSIEILRKTGRLMDIVSRGGAFLCEWMLANRRENPFYEYFDRVIGIAKRYDVTLSLGDGLRPGAIKDASDAAQISELVTLGQLQKRALAEGVQVMIEGPGHVPIDEIAPNVAIEKKVCGGAPFYVLGPLVTDVAPGYDHITAAIGGAVAGSAGADFLCYVTPAEHLRLPTLDDVKEGVIATKIAAHAADIAKGVKGAVDWDNAISRARRERNWTKQFELAIDRSRPREYRRSSRPGMKDVCTMCGDYCSIKTSEKCLRAAR